MDKPLILGSLQFISNLKAPVFVDGRLIIKSTLTAWDRIWKWEKIINDLSPVTSIKKNSDYEMVGSLCGKM